MDGVLEDVVPFTAYKPNRHYRKTHTTQAPIFLMPTLFNCNTQPAILKRIFFLFPVIQKVGRVTAPANSDRRFPP
jgi:hypothetical protein